MRLTVGQLLPEGNTPTTPVPLEKLRKLVDLYFDDLKTPLEAVVRGRDKLGEYIAGSIRSHNALENERMRLRSEMHDIYTQNRHPMTKTPVKSIRNEVTAISLGQ